MTRSSAYTGTEDQRKARLLRVLLISFGAFVAVGLIIALVRSQPFPVIGSEGALLLVLALCYGLLRRGHLRLASILFLGGWVALVIGSLLSPTSSPMAFLVISAVLLPATVATSMLLTPRSSFVTATAITLLLLGAVALRGGWSAADLAETEANEAIFLSIPLFVNYVLATLSWLFGRDVMRAIAQSQRDAEALAVQLATNQSLMVEIAEAATQLALTAEELATTMEEINVGAEQVAATVGQMATGASSQARRAEESSRAMAQLADATRQIAGNARQAGISSTMAREWVRNTAQVIQSLGEKLGMIEQVAALVDKVADQTNLLSLNASIEAARAGEHGAGFAVVADEVRRLADNSATSAGEIAAQSQEIGRRLEEVLTAMEEAQRAVEETATLVQETATTTKEQEQATETMVAAVNEMAAVAEESAASSEEIASSVEQQVVSMEQVSNSAQVLAELASTLQQTVGDFAINSDLTCPHFALCPIFERFSTDEAKHDYISHYCEGDFETCARKKLKDAGQRVPPTMLPDGSELVSE